MKNRSTLALFLIAALCTPALTQTVSQVVNTIAVGGITGLGAGVATLLGGASSGTGGPAGTTSPSFTTPVLGAATATSINFGGTTLNTYTAGSWTPTIIGSSTPGTGQTYTTQVGSYEQIGRQVILRFNLIVTGIGTAAGSASIGNLPIAAANVASDGGYCYIANYAVTGLAALNYGVGGVIVPNTSLIDLYSGGNVAAARITLTQTGAAPYFQGFCSYRAS